MRSRKVYILTMFVVIALFLTLAVADAQAWSFGGAKDWIMDNALEVGITALFTIVGAFFGATTFGKILLKAKLPIMELKDIAVKVHAARRPASAGGKQITTQEKDEILKEVEELIASVVNVFGSGK